MPVGQTARIIRTGVPRVISRTEMLGIEERILLVLVIGLREAIAGN